jgi:hypothetical protein
MGKYPVSKEIEIKTPFLRIAAKQWGPADGIPVLGLHGWLDNASTFDRIAPLLPRINLISMPWSRPAPRPATSAGQRPKRC